MTCISSGTGCTCCTTGLTNNLTVKGGKFRKHVAFSVNFVTTNCGGGGERDAALTEAFYQQRSNDGIVFSNVCLTVCLSVCQRDNSRTVTDIITKFSEDHHMIEREAKFENGCIGVGSW